MSRLFFLLGTQIVRYRFLFLLFIVSISILSVLGITKRLQDELPIDFTPQAIFMDKSPQMLRLREIEKSFGREDNDYILSLRADDLSTPENRRYIEKIHTTVEKNKFVESVDSLYNAYTILDRDDHPEVVAIWDSDSPIKTAQKAPFLKRILISEDGGTTTIRIRIDPSKERVADLSPVIRALDEQILSIQKPADMRIYKTGVPYIRTEVVSMMIMDNVAYTPILVVLFFVTICLLFRKVRLGLAPLLGVLTAVIWSLGLLISGGVVFNVLSILVPVLALIIGVADGIHLVERYREELAQRKNTTEAMGHTLKYMSAACFLTTFTTAAGFSSLLIAQTSVIRDFGLHSAIAVMISFVAVMLVVPCYLAFLPVDAVIGDQSREKKFFDAMHELVQKKPRSVAMFVITLTCMVGLYGSTVRPNSHILEMYHADHPTYKAIEHIEENMSGIVPIFIHFEAENEVLLEPEHLIKMLDLERSLQEFDWVLWTYSLPSQLQYMHTLLTEERTLPRDEALIQQELFSLSLSGNLPLESVTQNNYQQMRILALCKDAGGRSYIDLHQKITQEAETLFDNTPIRVDVTGDGLLASLGIDHLIFDLLYSILLVLIVILGTMLVLLRDIKLALLSIIPNIIPLLFTLATLRFIGADLQTSNVVSFTVSVGLAVDDTIHFVVRYKQERSMGKKHRQAMRNTFRGAGHAIILTTLLLIVGFGTLATSSLTSTFHFGLLTCVTLFAAILADLFLLPSLMNLIYDKQ